MINPANNHESHSMELSWAWEPAYREGAWKYHHPSVVFLAETWADEARLD